MSVAVPDEGLIATLSSTTPLTFCWLCVRGREGEGKGEKHEEEGTRQSKCVHLNGREHLFTSVCVWVYFNSMHTSKQMCQCVFMSISLKTDKRQYVRLWICVMSVIPLYSSRMGPQKVLRE